MTLEVLKIMDLNRTRSHTSDGRARVRGRAVSRSELRQPLRPYSVHTLWFTIELHERGHTGHIITTLILKITL